jgi:hypothetical protein
MRKVILLLILMPYMAFGQIIDDFEKGNISNWASDPEGRWDADSVSAISGNYSLHHSFDNISEGNDRIGIPLENLHLAEGLTSWSFLVRHGYEPSSSNNWAVYLTSSAAPYGMTTDGTSSGFVVGVNLSGYDDTLRLWKVNGSILTTVLSCPINWQNDIGIADAASVIVERTAEGNWSVSAYGTDGSLKGSASGTDTEIFNTGWFGISYRYTSSRDRCLWFDDINISGVFYNDTLAPEMIKCTVAGRRYAEIVLSEEPASGLMVPENITLNDPGNKSVSVTELMPGTYIAEFADEFKNKEANMLYINNICDISGNCAEELMASFTPVWADPGDVVITEIMADPVPSVSLPEKEYVEIANRTHYSYSLKGWKLNNDNKDYLFPELTIDPMEILIICSLNDTILFTEYGKTAGLKQFPSLTQGGSFLCLNDSSGALIHGVEYSSLWYGDELKSDGGWSLEMVDKDYPFFDKGNWKASSSRKGGSPGIENSIANSNPDITFEGIRNVFPEEDSSVVIRFSEPVFDLSSLAAGIQIGGDEITDIYPADPMFRKFTVTPAVPLAPGTVYQLYIFGDIQDFAGNSILRADFDFGLPEPPEPGDILFNELLFNPWPGDPDYIELFNRSEKTIDASRLLLVSVNAAAGDTSGTCQISVEKTCIIPGTYYAFSSSAEKVTERYYSADKEHLYEVGSLPSMPDDKGHLILFSRQLDMLDEVSYTNKMHYSLLSNVEGIALEKTVPNSKSTEAGNWHSASESSGWGTPGATNSVFTEFPSDIDRIEFSSTKISPDNDGTEDLLVIQLGLTGIGNVVSVSIFDETGNLVNKIADNMLAGADASIIWDGTAADGTLVRTGIYIVFITLYDDKGKINRWKKVCTVIRN